MKTSTFAALGGIVLLAAVSAPAWGIANITSSEQSLRAEVSGTPDVQANISAGPFNATAHDDSGGAEPLTRADAAQNSDAQGLLFSGTGSADLIDNDEAEINDGTAQSIYRMFFNLLTPHAYSLSGLLDTGTDGGSAFASIQLSGPSTNLLFVTLNNSAALPVNDSGVLPPGSYDLHVRGTTFDNDDQFYSAHSDWQFSLTLREVGVPEPLTPALLAMAGGSLLFGRRTGRKV